MGRLWKWLQERFWISADEMGGGYKFFWMGCEKGIHGAGLLVADRWIEKCCMSVGWSERIMVLIVESDCG